MLKMLDDGELKHRKHFGKRNNPCSNLPYRLHSAALTVINSMNFNFQVNLIKFSKSRI